MSGASQSVVSIGLALVLGVGSAWAQQPVSPIEQQHRRGIAMLRQGQNEQALGVFREIYERTREPRALWRMATAEAALGRWVEAEGHMSSAFGSSSDAWVHSQRAGLEQTLRQVQARVGLLTVRCNVPGAVIEVGGRPVTTFPVHVVAGDVQVSVRAEGYQAATTTVGVPGNVERAFVYEVNLLPVAAERSSLTRNGTATDVNLRIPASPGPDSRPGVGPWILVGMGGASLVTSVVMYVLSNGAASNRDSVCPVHNQCDGDAFSRANAAEDDRLTFQTVGGLALGVGAAAVGAGVLWRLLSHSSSRAVRQGTGAIHPYFSITSIGLRGNL